MLVISFILIKQVSYEDFYFRMFKKQHTLYSFFMSKKKDILYLLS